MNGGNEMNDQKIDGYKTADIETEMEVTTPMSDQQPIPTPISEAAKEAAEKFLTGANVSMSQLTYLKLQDTHQLAIDLATQSLQSERDQLKNAIALLEHGKYGRTDMAMQILALEAERDQLRQALTRIAGCESAVQGLAPHLYGHASQIAREALNHSKSPTQ